MKSIYLAGGMKNNWREIFKNNNFIIYDPCIRKLTGPKNYTSWDIKCVEKADIILGYIEKDNISGYGLSFEVGYGKALGKTIIWVEEDKECPRNKYFGMIREMADYIFYDIEDAYKFIINNQNIL